MNIFRSSFFRNPSSGPMFSHRELISMTIPFILSFVLSLLVGMLDTVMVSSVGDAAVSGVSLVDNLVQLFVFVFMAFGTGGAVICGQYLGSGQDGQASSCLEQLLWMSAITASAIMALLYLSGNGVLSLFFGAISGEVRREALIYMNITLASLPAMAVYEAGIAAVRALGDSRATLRISLTMNAINLSGNALLIYGFHMGTAGVAWPTLISRWAAAVLILLYFLSDRRKIHLSHRLLPVFRREMIVKILQVGIPSGVENGVFQLGKLFTVRFIAMSGTAAIAANAVAIILTNIVSVPGWGINNSIMTVISRCIGKRDTAQARYYHRILLVSAMVILALWAGIICLNLPLILRLFGNLTAEARTIARYMVYIHAAGMALIWSPAFMTPAALKAAGDVNYAMIVSIVSMWIFRVGGAYLLARHLGLGAPGVWVAMDIDWIFRAALYLKRWRGSAWESKRVI